MFFLLVAFLKFQFSSVFLLQILYLCSNKRFLQIQQLIDSFDISEVEARLDNMEAQLAELTARPKVEPLTQQQYNRKAHEPNVLYVIVQE